MDRICCLRTPTTEPAARAILGEVSSLPIRPASHFSACRFDCPIGVARLQHVRLMRQRPCRGPARPLFWKGLGGIRFLCLATWSLGGFAAAGFVVGTVGSLGAKHPNSIAFEAACTLYITMCARDMQPFRTDYASSASGNSRHAFEQRPPKGSW